MIKKEVKMMEDVCKDGFEANENEKLTNDEHERMLLQYFVEESSHGDCIIQTKDGYFLCHSLILAAANIFFRQLLETNERDNLILIMMLDYTSSELQTMLTAAYKHDFTQPEQNKVFYTEGKPTKLLQLLKENFKTREEILALIQSQHEELIRDPLQINETNSIFSNEHIEIDSMKEEIKSPMHDSPPFIDEELKLENLEDFLPEFVADKSINKNVPKIKKPKINRLHKERKIRNQKCTTENDKETTMADKTAQSENDFVFIPKKSAMPPKSEWTPASAYPIKCPNCPKMIMGKSMKYHHSRKCFGPDSNKKASRICHLCGASFKHRKALDHHISIKCANSCNICGQVFKLLSERREHLLMTHGKIMKFKRRSEEEMKEKFACEKCDKLYRSQGGLDVHVRKVHDGISCDHQCNECGKFLHSGASLKRHVLLHKPPELPCPTCGKLFHNKSYLRIHLQDEHIPQQERKFKCDMCEKAFITNKCLSEHRNVHLNLKPFKCRWCDKYYQNSSNQNAHERASHWDAYVLVTKVGAGKRIRVKQITKTAEKESVDN